MKSYLTFRFGKERVDYLQRIKKQPYKLDKYELDRIGEEFPMLA